MNSNLASLLCTTGGSCLGSPTNTNLWALKRGPREAGCRIWEASSMIQTSNRLCVNTGWVIPSAVVATTLYRRDKCIFINVMPLINSNQSHYSNILNLKKWNIHLPLTYNLKVCRKLNFITFYLGIHLFTNPTYSANTHLWAVKFSQICNITDVFSKFLCSIGLHLGMDFTCSSKTDKIHFLLQKLTKFFK